MDEYLLEQIGLTKSEIKVYEALLELGSSSTGKIVDKAGVASSKVYEVLDKLMQKGLVSTVNVSGVKHFEAAAPDRLMDYMEEKEKELAQQKKQLQAVLPELTLKQQLSKYKAEAKIYKGQKGVETAFYQALNMLKKGEEELVMGIPIVPLQTGRFFVKFDKERARRGILLRAIVNNDARDNLQVRANINLLAQLKFLPQTTPAAFNIFKDRVLIYYAGKENLLIQIDSKEVCDSFRAHFELQWNQDTTVTKGFNELKRTFIDFLDELQSTRQEYKVIGAGFGEPGSEEPYIRVFNSIAKERLKRGIKTKIIYEQGTEWAIKSKESDFRERAEKKFLPYSTQSPVAILPSKDKTLLLIQKDEPAVITINNKEVSASFLKQFEMLWNQDTSTTAGFDEVTCKFNDMLSQLEKGEEYYVLGASLELGDKKMNSWLDTFHKRRVEEGKRVRFLSAKEAYEPIRKCVQKAGDAKMAITMIRYLPSSFTAPFQINLFKKDTVWFTVWKPQVRCFEIRSKDVYGSFKTYFDALWSQAGK